MKIYIRKPDEEEIRKLSINEWPIWESPVTVFSWEYDTTEICYFIAGRVVIKTEDGQEYEIQKGDLVRFPAGLRCVWDVREPVRKHYSFE